MNLLQNNISSLEVQRLEYLPSSLELIDTLKQFYPEVEHTSLKLSVYPEDKAFLKDTLPYLSSVPNIKLKKTSSPQQFKSLKIGVLLSGGQAPGGHNIVIGLYKALKSLNSDSQLFGFFQGPLGLIFNSYKELACEDVNKYLNTGGFDMLTSSREKIENIDQQKAALKAVTKLGLDGLLIIGGDNSNTNTAILAEYFAKNKSRTAVIGVPKTIDGDLKNTWIELPLGFDTASKVFSEMIGNLAKDSLSIKKYYHFVRIMGQSSSHMALECALKTQPNLTLISEEISQTQTNLKSLARFLANFIEKRHKKNKNYGVLLIPEGLIQQIPDTKQLIKELNLILANTITSPSVDFICKSLSKESLKTFTSLPLSIQSQFLLNRDSHGNVRVSKIETEQLLVELVKEELRASCLNDFLPITHFFGYEARSAFPSNFDSNYGLALGILSAILLNYSCSGYMAGFQNLEKSVSNWKPIAIPLYNMLHITNRKGVRVPVIKRGLVETSGKAFKYFKRKRKKWLYNDNYVYPGPMQLIDESFSETLPLSLLLK